MVLEITLSLWSDTPGLGSEPAPDSSYEPGSLTWDFLQEFTLSPQALSRTGVPRSPHKIPGLTQGNSTPPTLCVWSPSSLQVTGLLRRDPCRSHWLRLLSCSASDSMGCTLPGKTPSPLPQLGRALCGFCGWSPGDCVPPYPPGPELLVWKVEKERVHRHLLQSSFYYPESVSLNIVKIVFMAINVQWWSHGRSRSRGVGKREPVQPHGAHI